MSAGRGVWRRGENRRKWGDGGVVGCSAFDLFGGGVGLMMNRDKGVWMRKPGCMRRIIPLTYFEMDVSEVYDFAFDCYSLLELHMRGLLDFCDIGYWTLLNSLLCLPLQACFESTPSMKYE